MEVTLLPVKPGTLSKENKIELKKAGIIVIEVDNPEEIKLISQMFEVGAGDILACAMSALVSQTGQDAQYQRQTFTIALAEVIKKQHDKEG